MSQLNDLMLKIKARGNWGHGGRPGKRGGSTSKSSGGGATTSNPAKKAAQKSLSDLAKNYHGRLQNSKTGGNKAFSSPSVFKKAQRDYAVANDIKRMGKTEPFPVSFTDKGNTVKGVFYEGDGEPYIEFD